MTKETGLYEVMYNCRAMRRLSSDPIPEQVLLRLIESAEQAASASNTQRRRWIIVRDPACKARIAELNRRACETGVKSRIAAGEALPHHDASTRKRMLNAVLWLAHNMQHIHALIVACHEFDDAPDAAERARVQSSVYPAVQNLLLAARAEGLGAVLTTYALRDYDAFTKALELPENFAAYALIPVGYPLGKFGPVARRQVSEVVRFDKWS